MFKKRLKDAKRFQKLRMACFAGVYFSVISATLGATIAFFGNVTWLEAALAAIGALATSLFVVFFVGVFVTTRALGHIEIDLFFYSEESRQARRRGPPAKHSEPRIPESNRAGNVQNGEETPSSDRRRVYRRPPLSSYRP